MSANDETMPETKPIITHAHACEIANVWHGGGGSPLYQFVSTGAIVPGVVDEVNDCIASIGEATNQDTLDREDLRDLRVYLQHYGERGPLPRWYQEVICKL